MNDLQSLSAYPVGARPEAAIEEITVKGEKSGDARFTFWDFLDVINPLQHIPVVNTIYREITGDEIKAPAKMIGSAIIGGPIGLAVAMVDSIIEDTTGKDMGGHALAMFKNETPASPTAPQPESLAATAATTATTAVAATASAASLGPAPSPREFIPTGRATGATLASLPSGLTLTASFLIEADEDEETVEAQRANQETEAAIAAAAAAAPQGQVFIPLAGRQPASFKSVATEQSQARFLPIDRTGRAASGRTAAARQQLDQAAVAQLQAQGALPGGLMQESSRIDPMLEATRPQGDTGKLPAADPFAAARLLSEEPNPVMVPAWFDKAMMDAMGKYQAMQSVGS